MEAGQASAPERNLTTGGNDGERRPSGAVVFTDRLYQRESIAAWAATLLATQPFQRLAGISLSDVPGHVLFGHPFPSRLEHSRGVYHLTRISRPRDRILQAAALAHDLGHGPFSHLTEPLMRELLGIGHEERSVHFLAYVRASLPATALRRLAWLDWDEVGALVLGDTSDGRGQLLNGRLDYDNIDNVARFLVASGLGGVSYDPIALARALRVAAPAAHQQDGADRRGPVAALAATAVDVARGWVTDRVTVYTYLHEQHRNLALHAMLRKAIDLATEDGALGPAFLDYTDAQALSALRRGPRAVSSLAERVAGGPRYRCVWEAEVATRAPGPLSRQSGWRDRLALEQRLAYEAGMSPPEVIIDVLASSARRALPPLVVGSGGSTDTLEAQPEPAPAPRVLHLFVTPEASRDGVRRLRGAAERLLTPLGATACASYDRD